MAALMNRFDQIGDHFIKNIHKRAKGVIRLAVLQRDLAELVEQKTELHILDAGGGAGQMAMWFLAQGCRVTLIDQSKLLLKQAWEAACACGVEDRLTIIHGDLADENSYPKGMKYDGVCCHAVLEWVADFEPILNQILVRLSCGGFFSLMYYNRSALNFIHHIYGNFEYVDQGLINRNAAKLTPSSPRTRQEVDQLLEGRYLSRYSLTGVRCFYDYMKPRDRARNSEKELIIRELGMSTEKEYLPIARYIHDLRILSIP
ncbi:methyltransferase domain-containing protein [Cardiobacteriaceae bacterium TAE3-ERU3]|nr:methyltransferase domain-containing protein [Cardiobacteriaceae bacterium TAE3-ERU3]